MERLQKTLAQAGIGSRRQCERIIAEGRVTVNDSQVTEMGVQVDAGTDVIRVDGARIKMARHKVYYLLNKPRDYICSQADEFGRRRAVDLLGGVKEKVYPVGRLDKESQGLILFTNDGEFTNRMTHPRFGVPKTYIVLVKGIVKPSDMALMTKGMYFSDGKMKAENARIVRISYSETAIQITLREGRNREIRRMLAALNYRVKRLKRVRIGQLTDRNLGVGQYREVTALEIKALLGGEFEGTSRKPKSKAAEEKIKQKPKTKKRETNIKR
ncbi:MAG: pseudouridine synthase [Planctomycetota bacterium]|nr:pseudouridine synthase [Planctomycetota bacterium]MDA1136971.1 pseudouridine synthase [Planctomycetota bacterium]